MEKKGRAGRGKEREIGREIKTEWVEPEGWKRIEGKGRDEWAEGRDMVCPQLKKSKVGNGVGGEAKIRFRATKRFQRFVIHFARPKVK